MVKNILFRAKAKSNNQWVYGYYRYDKINDTHHIVDSVRPIDYEVIEETVGQQWKPSNNLVVFTDDLISVLAAPTGVKKPKQMIANINYSGKGFSVSLWHNKEWWAHGYIDYTTAKIIGNIHDNANLLN